MCHEAGNFSVPTVLYSVPRVTSFAITTSVGRTTSTPALLGRREDPPGVVDPVVLGQALADRLALGEEERVRHPAAEDEEVDLRQEVLDDLDLVADLRSAEDRRERPLRVLEEPAQDADLALHQEARVGRQEPGDPDRRGVGPMGRPERVVHEDVGVRRERLGELRVVLLLLRVEAEVLEEDRLARPHPLDGVLGADPERVAGHGHVPPQELAQALADRPQPEPVLDLAVGPAEVAGEDDLRARAEERRDRRQGGPDARVVGDLAVGERDVEVDADEDALARGVEVADGQLVHGHRRPRRQAAATGRRAATKPIRSATRQL